MLIKKWLQGTLTGVFEPVRVVATIVATCNLRCQHCFWDHDLNDEKVSDWSTQIGRIRSWGVPVVYAGRILNSKGCMFVRSCLAAGFKIGLVDHGYTIFNLTEKELKQLSHINISIDGWREDHDTQRNQVGAFDKAWGAVQSLREMGLDPIISACLSSTTFPNWNRFEDLLARYDVPISVALISEAPAVRDRGTSLFDDPQTCCEAFKLLVEGVPKVINLYDLNHVKFLQPILKDMKWELDQEEGDSLVATLASGTQVFYRPHSVLLCAETTLRWDGVFYLPTLERRATPIDSLEESHRSLVQSFNAEELKLWQTILN